VREPVFATVEEDMETKAFRSLKLQIKSVNEDGEFEGYASTREKDQGGDIILEGAFKRTIDQNGGVFPILWFHDPTQPIGLGSVKEDGHGLYTKGKLNLDKQLGRDVHSDMKFGVVDRMSIGYITVESEWDDKKQARIISELKLLEYSLITKNFAMNEHALVTAVKRQGGKGADVMALLRDNITNLLGAIRATEASLFNMRRYEKRLYRSQHQLAAWPKDA
jgi:uncharacterized protein